MRSAQRQANKGGQRAEDAVARVNAHYAAQCKAWAVKRPTPVRMTGQVSTGGAFRAVWVSASGVDFAGAVNGGRAVAFDVKRSGGPSIPLEPRPGVPCVRPSQVEELDTLEDLGAITGILALLHPRVAGHPTPVWVWVPWPAWKLCHAAAVAAGRKSLSLAQLRAAGHQCSTYMGGPLWLGPALDGR